MDQWVLAAIVLLAGALRFYGLDIQSFWIDELASVVLSKESIFQILRNHLETNPPAYYAILHFVQEYLGNGEWALRLPSAIAGVLAVPSIYLLGRRLYSEQEGLFAALFTAVFWCPIYYSQEARAYSLLLLFSILTAYFWWGILVKLRARERVSALEAAGYVVSAIVCSYLHYYGAYLVALQGAALIVLARKAIPRVLLLYLPVVVAYLPWLPTVVAQFRTEGFWIEPPQPSTLTKCFGFLFGRSGLLQILALMLFSLLLLRAWKDVRSTTHTTPSVSAPRGALLSAWVAVPFAVAYLFSAFSTPLLVPRYLIISLPAAYLLLSRAITRSFSSRSVQATIALGLAGLSIGQLLFAMDYYTRPHKEQWREVVHFVTADEQPSSLIAYCVGVAWEGPIGILRAEYFNYYFRRQRSHRIVQVKACKPSDLPILKGWLDGQHYHYLYYLYGHKKPQPEVLRFLYDEFELVRHREFIKAGAYLFRVSSAGSGHDGILTAVDRNTSRHHALPFADSSGPLRNGLADAF